jgi:uncharacterized protein (DUF488 family)
MKLFTIGHGNHTYLKFTELLEANHIKWLVDVRTTPYSKFCGQFDKEIFSSRLSMDGFHYIFLGKNLGGRPADPNCYKSRKQPGDKEEIDYLHEVDYPVVMQQGWFVEGISQLLSLARKQATTIMCSEEDPARCHRHHLIAKYLLAHDPEIEIQHIRGDGHVFNARDLHVSVEKDEAHQGSLL